jgi:hypothetical protein
MKTRELDDCVSGLVPALMDHLTDDKLSDRDTHLLRRLSDKIHEVLGDDCGEDSETENEDSGDEQEEKFSIRSGCHVLTRELQRHSGELTSYERTCLLELIESAAKVMRFY